MNAVVDASVAIKWFVPEALSNEAQRLLDGGAALFAPDFLLIEFGNIIWKKVRLGELAHGDGDAALTALRSGPVGLVDTTLCARYRRLAARGKPHTVVTAAIAREMGAFIWAIARYVQPAEQS